MKEIKAFIRPEKLSEVYDALNKAGFCCLTVFTGEGTGKYTDPKKDFPSLNFPYLHSKVVKLEMVTKDENADEAARIIQQQGSTGTSGDGLIYLSGVEEVVRIRDGNKGMETLHH